MCVHTRLLAQDMRRRRLRRLVWLVRLGRFVRIRHMRLEFVIRRVVFWKVRRLQSGRNMPMRLRLRFHGGLLL